jgi:hypothetical protein
MNKMKNVEEKETNNFNKLMIGQWMMLWETSVNGSCLSDHFQLTPTKESLTNILSLAKLELQTSEY